MSYTTQQDILDFVEDNNVKFVRFAFCDIFGFQKNRRWKMASASTAVPSQASCTWRRATWCSGPTCPP